MIRRLDRAIFATDGNLRAVALMRAIVGVIVVLHLKHELRGLWRGDYFADYFYVPYVDWYPVLPRDAYFAALIGCVAAGVLMTVGVMRRAATWYALAFVAYNFFASKTHFHHNRAFLLVMLIGLALVPVTRIRGAGRGPLWPVWWMRFEHSLIFFASGFSKLVDPDWFGGIVMWERALRQKARMVKTGVPEALVDLVTDPTFHAVFSKITIAAELFIALGLWFRKTRVAAIWVAIVFHLSIEVTARVQIFSLISLSAMLLWVTPEIRYRTAVVNRAARGGRAVAWCLRWLDWLARFRIETTSDPAAPAVTVDGDARGAAALVLTRLPATFFFAWPVSVAARAWRRLAG